MSSQIQNEINQRTQELAKLKRADEWNKAQAERSMMSGDYGQENYLSEINASDPKIAKLEGYINSLNGVINMVGNDEDKLRAFKEIQVSYNNPNNSSYGWGGRRRYKKKSVKRNRKKMTKRRNTRKNTKRNTRRRK